MNPFQTWQNFYVVVGSASAALIGLMFVVVTLIAGTPMRRNAASVAAFGSPTVVHFCGAFLIAVVACAPWPNTAGIAITLGTGGFVGVVYICIVFRQALRQTAYKPVLEDWIWHNILPFIAYATLIVVALVLPTKSVVPLFATGASALLLVFIGIHNSWDTVVYVLYVTMGDSSTDSTRTPSSGPEPAQPHVAEPSAAAAEALITLPPIDRSLDGLTQLRSWIAMGGRPPIGYTLGIALTQVDAGHAVFEGTPGASVYNPLGVVHGGYAAALLDSACGCAVHSRLAAGQGYTTVELSVMYHKAITSSTGRVRAEGHVVTVGRRVAFAQAKLTDASGALLASGTSTLLIT